MTQPIPAVSVIMNCRNSAKFLDEAIQSVVSQTFTDWEIVFFDNQSTDESPEIAKKYLGKLKYFRSDRMMPLGEARNQAVTKATGKYIALLDCDDLWKPEKLKTQVDIFERDSKIGLVFSGGDFIDGSGNQIDSTYQTQPSPKEKNVGVALISRGCYIICPTIMMRRDAVLEVGGFDQSLHYIEEYDLCIKVALRWKAEYVPQKLASYRVHGSNLGMIAAPNMFKESIRQIKSYYSSEIEKFSCAERFQVFLTIWRHRYYFWASSIKLFAKKWLKPAN